MRRRTLVGLMSLPLVTGWRRLTDGGAGSKSAPAEPLAALFGNPAAAAALGAWYLSDVARDARSVAAPALWSAGSSGAGALQPGALRACFEQQRQADFLAGRTVLVQGWVMARCELDACVLLAARGASGSGGHG